MHERIRDGRMIGMAFLDTYVLSAGVRETKEHLQFAEVVH